MTAHRLPKPFVLAFCIVLGVLAVPVPVTAADEISDGQWYVSALRLAEAHKITKGKGVVVAVIDTGIDPAHPDLVGSVQAGADFSLGSTGGDGLKDIDGHGTGMASLIAGHGRIQGVAPEATVMSVRSTTGGGGSPSLDAQAINWAVNHGATVISVSLSAPDGHFSLREAVANAYRRNVVVVAGAGNVSKGDTRVGYPAAYDGALAVGGTGKDGNYSAAAVTGPQIRIAAPCDRISTARHNKAWVVGTGTSNATALVAGAAALIRAQYPDLHARDVINRLTATATDKGWTGRDNETGFGLLNIPAALTADVPLLPPEPQAPQGTPTPALTTGAPVAAPGAEFPVGITIISGLVCTILITVIVAVVLIRSRRRHSGIGPPS